MRYFVNKCFVKQKGLVRNALLLLTMLAASLASAAEKASANKTPATASKVEANVVLHSTITGNQEQPKVLYIVPWQGPGGADQLNQPVQPLLSDVFAPVDRAEFRRELKYRADGANTEPAL